MLLTIAIASHQRREALKRLLVALSGEIGADPGLVEAVEVVVVLDGSTDGSEEMLRALSFPVPIRVLWQENSGLSATRNAGLRAAEGHLVWLLDDDLLPTKGLIHRHLESHRRGGPHILVGPCLIPEDWDAPDSDRRFYKNRYSRPSETGEIRRFDDFSAANTSGPVELFLRVGGFNESFVGWGGEEYELAVRLLDAGVEIRFDDQAVAWHLRQLSPTKRCMNLYEAGRNVVRLANLHPQLSNTVVPPRYPRSFFRLLSHLGVRSPGALLTLSKLIRALAAVLNPLVGRRSNRLVTLAGLASYSAGVAAADEQGELIGLLLGSRSKGSTDPDRPMAER